MSVRAIARDLWHLVSRLYRKVAAHTLRVLPNRQLGRLACTSMAWFHFESCTSR